MLYDCTLMEKKKKNSSCKRNSMLFIACCYCFDYQLLNETSVIPMVLNFVKMAVSLKIITHFNLND